MPRGISKRQLEHSLPIAADFIFEDRGSFDHNLDFEALNRRQPAKMLVLRAARSSQVWCRSICVCDICTACISGPSEVFLFSTVGVRDAKQEHPPRGQDTGCATQPGMQTTY